MQKITLEDNKENKKLDELRANMFDSLLAAEKAAYAYFQECDVGPNRDFAYEVYDRIRRATLR